MLGIEVPLIALWMTALSNMQQPLTAPPPPAITLATARDVVDRMTIGVFVNGRGPFPFAIDTGSDRSVIARSLADQLALPAGRRATMHAMAGVGDIATVRIDRLGIAGREVADVDAPVLADTHLGAQGLLGIDGLSDQRIEMDFVSNTMTIVPSTVVEQREPGTIVVTARRRFGQLILADAEIDGQKVYVIVDSGAQVSIGNAALRRRLRTSQASVVQARTVLTDVAGRDLSAEYGTLSQVRIGGVRIDNMPIVYADVHPFRMFGIRRQPALMLGMDILRSFRRVSVDFGNKRVRFLLAGRR